MTKQRFFGKYKLEIEKRNTMGNRGRVLLIIHDNHQMDQNDINLSGPSWK
jgi:hypothetical protein|tara:strand:- start:658 stop:807 length:150 start_codon:yes stop_codon:yes gene_type:complete